MDPTAAILIGLTLVTLAAGYLDGNGFNIRGVKARGLLALAELQAARARRAAHELKSTKGQRRLESAINLLRRVEEVAQSDLDADDTIERVAGALKETAGMLRDQAEATMIRMGTFRTEAVRLTNRLQTLPPNTGEFDDSDHAAA